MKAESRRAFWAVIFCAACLSVLGACRFLGESAGEGEVLDGMDLLMAVESGEVDRARELLAAGVVPGGRIVGGQTALMLALGQGESGLALELIEKGADLEAVDGLGGSVLYYGVRNGETAVVRALLEHGMNPNENVTGGGSMVAYAVETGRTASAQLLFGAGATEMARSADGTPVSFHAARRGALWMLKEILDGGSGVDTRDDRGDALVHFAVREGQSDLLRVLWLHGADPNAVNKAGDNALHVALARNRVGMVPELLKHGGSVVSTDKAGRQPLHLALERGNIEAMRLLLENGADPEASGPDGKTPMRAAIAKREFAAAQLLADHRAGVDGFLRGAVGKKDAELFDFLMANGADPNPEGGDSPLVIAVRGGESRMAEVLMKTGADVEVPVKEGQSLFHLAVALGDVATATMMIERGADVNQEFSYPASDEFVKLVKSEGLIKWFLKKDRRVTPLMMAADSGNLAMAKLLVEHGAKKNIWTRRHRHWPINFASRRDDVKIMQLLLGRDPDAKGRTMKVDLSEQRAWVYDADGKELLSTRISSGKKGFRTKTGVFVITNKYKQWKSTIYDGASMPYFQRLSCGDFGFHRGYVPRFAASHGCIRVPSGSARKLYGLTRTGDVVTIVE